MLLSNFVFFFFNDTATTEIYTLSLHDALPILVASSSGGGSPRRAVSGLDSQRVAMVNAVVERRGGVRLADADVFAASVGGGRIIEPAADLALALPIASAAEDRPVPVGPDRLREGGRPGADR